MVPIVFHRNMPFSHGFSYHVLHFFPCFPRIFHHSEGPWNRCPGRPHLGALVDATLLRAHQEEMAMVAMGMEIEASASKMDGFRSTKIGE